MDKVKKIVKVIFAMFVAITLGAAQPVDAASDTVVIYEVYGGGGNSGATFKNDYVVLKNVSNVDQSLDGLYVHRGSSNSWYESVALTGTLKPGQYYVIEAQEGFNKDAKDLPRTGDVKAPGMGIGAKNFSIALTRSPDTPSDADTIDLLGAGTATLREGSPSKAGANNVSIRRVNDIDTDNNANDFEAISLEETSLDYLNNDESTTDSEPEIIPEESVVTIDPNGGTMNDWYKVQNIKKGQQYTIDNNAFKLKKEGYKFGGFKVEGKLLDRSNNPVDFIQYLYGQKLTPVGDVKLTATWEHPRIINVVIKLDNENNDEFNISDYKVTLTNIETKEVFTLKKHPNIAGALTANALPRGEYDVKITGPAENEIIESVERAEGNASAGTTSKIEFNKENQSLLIAIDNTDDFRAQAWYTIRLTDSKPLPSESVVTIDPNAGEMLEDKAKTVVKTGDAYTIDFEGNYKFYKDGYHFGGFDVIGDLEDKDGNKVEYIKRAHPFTEYYPKGDVTLKVRWKIMQGGQFRAYVKRDDNSAFGGQEYKLYLKASDTEERKFPYGVTKESQTHKMSLLQLKNDSYTLRVEGLADNEYIKEVRLNEDKYTQNQADTKIELIEKDKAEIAIKYDSHFIAPEVNFDVIIGKKPVEETYTFTLTGEGVNEVTVPGFKRDSQIKLNSVERDGYKFLGWNLEGSLFDAEGNEVTGIISDFDKVYYPGSDVVFTAVWEEVITEAEKASLIIYEVFGGGGKTGSLYANDYVVIKNTGDQPVNLDGMVLRKGLSNRWTDQSVGLSGELAPGAFYVISGGNDNEADGGERPVPAVDLADESFNFANRTFALALTTDNKLPSEDNTIDLVGTGKATNFEGKQAATGRNNVSLRRINDGQDTDNNRDDFARIEHLRDADSYPLAYLGDKDLRATATFAFNKAIDGVDIPEAQKVEVGTEITLPEVSPEVKDGYSFLGWAIGDNKNASAKLNPGDKITIDKDTTIMGIWEGAYGKVSLTFHTGEFIDDSFENRAKITKLEDEELKNAGFNVVNQQSGEVTEGKKSSYKGQISIGNGLVKGTYTLNVRAPEGYEIVKIKRNAGSNGPIEIENGSTISLPKPEAPFNLTLVDSIYVELRKSEQTFKVTVNSATGEYAETEVKENEKYTVQTAKSYNLLANEGEELVGYEIKEGSLKDDKDGNILSVGETIKAPANAWSKPQFEVLSDVVLEPIFKTTSGIIEIEVRDEDVFENPEIYTFTLVDDAGNEYNLNSTSKSSDGDGKFRIYSYRQPTIGDGEKLESGAYTLKVSNADGRVINEVDVRTSSFNNVKSHTQTIEEGKAKLQVVFNPQTGANPKVRFVVRLTEKIVEPTSRTINFVVDPEKGLATGALFAEVIEGEDPLEKAPNVEAKEGYNFIRWEASEDGLTYTAIFEEVEKPVKLIRDRSIRFEVQETIAGRSQLSVKTSKVGDVVVIEINGQEVLRRASNEADVFETYELNRTVKLNDKISVYIIRDKQYRSSKINNIINN